MAPSYDTTVRLTVSGTETVSSGWYDVYITPIHTPKKESKEVKRTRVALEKNRASWVTFNQKKPNVKQVIKPRTNLNQRR